MLTIGQRCRCNAEFSIVGQDGTALPIYRAWQRRHVSCEQRTRVPSDRTPDKSGSYPLDLPSPAEKAADWRGRYLDQPCTVCKEILTDRNVLTTHESKPVHITCKVCQFCGKRGPLHWINGRLYHKACERQEKERAKAATRIEALDQYDSWEEARTADKEGVATGDTCWICTRTDPHVHVSPGPVAPHLDSNDPPKPLGIIDIGPSEYHVSQDREPGQRNP